MSAVLPGGLLELAGVTKRFGSTTALDDVTLTLQPGTFTALLGPSGCGKSTLLSLVAGLVHPDAGRVDLDGTSLLGLLAERRPVGLVFQKPLLFPHMSVLANIGFGLRVGGSGRREVRRVALEMLERVQLAGLADRHVGELSGGQEQRVALARALVLSPRVLLLDEPFSSLDAELRVTMRRLVRALADETGVTTLFVTHDQAEAVDVADDVVLVLGGRLVGHGPASGFWSAPSSLAAARFFGVTNEVAGQVRDGVFRCEGVSSAGGAVPASVPDGPAVLVVRPERLALGAAACPGLALPATVHEVRFAGTHLVLRLRRPDGSDLVAHAPVGTGVTPGAAVVVTAPADACAVLPAEGRAAT